MTRVTREEIERIAQLARLDVDSRTMAELTTQIAQILRYVSQLDGVESTGGEISPSWIEAPTIPPPRGGDITGIDLPPQLAAMAPAFRDGFFLVPRLEGLDEE